LPVLIRIVILIRLISVFEMAPLLFTGIVSVGVCYVALTWWLDDQWGR
jgi:hypothetical protein